MRKKLIVILSVALILLAVVVGVLIFLETRPNVGPQEQTVPTTTSPATEPVEETVGISLPTEDADAVTPEVTFDPADTTPAQTVDPDATQDPDENETPKMPL